MVEYGPATDYPSVLALLSQRVAQPAPGRIQLLAGPRQVGKTTLLLELADRLGPRALYRAADGPEAALPGFWERLWVDAEAIARKHRRAVVLLDEAHLLPRWAERLKGEWDRIRRKRLSIQVVATGSSALHLTLGSRESLAGRFERLTLTHWSAAALAAAFSLKGSAAAELLVQLGGYPGAFAFRKDPARWAAYVRDSILEPAIGRDLLAMAPVRKPALLRQVFAICAASPAQIVSLQKIQGQLQDKGALETVASYLQLLGDAYLVAALPKLAKGEARRRAAPPKLVTLNNALLSVSDVGGIPDRSRDPARYGRFVENACIAYAFNAGQRVTYWREEPFEVDAVLEGSWGTWALEIKTGQVEIADLRGLAELTQRQARYRPLVLAEPSQRVTVERAGFAFRDWRTFLLEGVAGIDGAGK